MILPGGGTDPRYHVDLLDGDVEVRTACGNGQLIVPTRRAEARYAAVRLARFAA